MKTMETYANVVGHQYVQALIERGEAQAWITASVDRSRHFVSDRADGRVPTRADAAASPARVFDCLVAPRSRRRGASARIGGALRKPRPASQGRGVELCRRTAQTWRALARQAAAEPVLRAAGAGQRHHHGWPGHGRGAVPRLRAGAPRDRRYRPQLGSSAIGSLPTTSCTSSNGRKRSKTARSPAWI
jgi:hypothetical protein